MGLTQRLASALGLGRAPSVDAQAVVTALLPGGSSRPLDRGVTGMLKSYNTSPWVRAVTAKISQSVGRASWQVYGIRRETSGKFFRSHNLQSVGVRRSAWRRREIDIPEGTELIEIGDHPALELLGGGANGVPGNVGRQMTQLYIELTGECFWLLEPKVVGSRMVPVNFWIIPPTWVVDFPTEEDGFFTLESNGHRVKLPAELMIWFRNPSALDLYGRGVGHMRALGDEIDTDEYTAKYIRSFFYNSARPDLLIFGKDLGPKDVKRLEIGWLQKARGFMQAHRPFFLGREVTVKDLTHKFSEMQMIDLRKWERDMLVNGRGMPPEILGIIENSNRATIDAADYLFGKSVIDPALDFIRGYLQSELMPLYDDRLILGYDSPVAEDKDFQLEALKAAPWTATINEWRQVQGLDAKDYGDVHVFPLNEKPVDLEDPEAFSQPSQPAITPEEIAEEEEDTDRALEAFRRGLQEGYACGCKTHAAAPDAAHAASGLLPPDATTSDAVGTVTGRSGRFKQLGGDAHVALAERLGKQMATDLLAAFDEIRNSINMNALISALNAGDIDAALAAIALADIPETMEPARATLKEAIYVVGSAAAAELADFLGVDFSFSMVSDAVLQELEEFGAGMVTNVSDQTVKGIRAALVESYAEGRTPAAAAKEIRDIIGLTERDARLAVKKRTALLEAGKTEAEADAIMEKWIAKKIKDRAETIALNELVEAANRGQEMTWETAVDLGLIDKDVVRRRWETVSDDKTCPICAPMQGALAKVGEPFSNGIITPNHSHVRCRCSEVLVFLKGG